MINLSKKKVDKKSFVIGEDEEKNEEHQVNADHLKEQLVSMITVKVRRFDLHIFFEPNRLSSGIYIYIYI